MSTRTLQPGREAAPVDRPARAFSKDGTPIWLVLVFLYMTLGAAFGPLDVRILGTSFVFLVIVLVGLRGLRFVERGPALRSYIVVAAPLAVWAIVSAIAAWDLSALHQSIGLVAWLIVIPGIAVWLRSATLRSALIAGYTLTAIVFCAAIFRRVVATGSALDPTLRSVMGTNRNAVAAVFAFLVPLIAAGPRWRVVRLCGVIALLGAIAASGSRSSLVGATAALVLLLVLAGRRELRLIIPFAIGALVLGLAVPSLSSRIVGYTTERFRALQEPKVAPEYELRQLVLHKSITLAREHPVFGVGMGKFETTTVGLAQQARFKINQERADKFQAHDTFAEALAAFGFVGGFFYLLFALMPLWMGIRYRNKRITHGPTAAYLALLVWSAYHSALVGNLLLLGVALVLGTAMASEQKAQPALVRA